MKRSHPSSGPASVGSLFPVPIFLLRLFFFGFTLRDGKGASSPALVFLSPGPSARKGFLLGRPLNQLARSFRGALARPVFPVFYAFLVFVSFFFSLRSFFLLFYLGPHVFTLLWRGRSILRWFVFVFFFSRSLDPVFPVVFRDSFNLPPFLF